MDAFSLAFARFSLRLLRSDHCIFLAFLRFQFRGSHFFSLLLWLLRIQFDNNIFRLRFRSGRSHRSAFSFCSEHSLMRVTFCCVHASIYCVCRSVHRSWIGCTFVAAPRSFYLLRYLASFSRTHSLVLVALSWSSFSHFLQHFLQMIHFARSAGSRLRIVWSSLRMLPLPRGHGTAHAHWIFAFVRSVLRTRSLCCIASRFVGFLFVLWCVLHHRIVILHQVRTFPRLRFYTGYALRFSLHISRCTFRRFAHTIHTFCRSDFDSLPRSRSAHIGYPLPLVVYTARCPSFVAAHTHCTYTGHSFSLSLHARVLRVAGYHTRSRCALVCTFSYCWIFTRTRLPRFSLTPLCVAVWLPYHTACTHPPGLRLRSRDFTDSTTCSVWDRFSLVAWSTPCHACCTLIHCGLPFHSFSWITLHLHRTLHICSPHLAHYVCYLVHGLLHTVFTDLLRHARALTAFWFARCVCTFTHVHGLHLGHASRCTFVAVLHTFLCLCRLVTRAAPPLSAGSFFCTPHRIVHFRLHTFTVALTFYVCVPLHIHTLPRSAFWHGPRIFRLTPFIPAGVALLHTLRSFFLHTFTAHALHTVWILVAVHPLSLFWCLCVPLGWFTTYFAFCLLLVTTKFAFAASRTVYAVGFVYVGCVTFRYTFYYAFRTFFHNLIFAFGRHLFSFTFVSCVTFMRCRFRVIRAFCLWSALTVFVYFTIATVYLAFTRISRSCGRLRSIFICGFRCLVLCWLPFTQMRLPRLFVTLHALRYDFLLVSGSAHARTHCPHCPLYTSRAVYTGHHRSVRSRTRTAHVHASRRW